MTEKDNIIDKKAVEKIQENLPKEEYLYELADFFKVFGDSTRIRILAALEISELCVGDIAYLLNMSQSAISHQLSSLKASRLVKGRREGKLMYYSLDDDHIEDIMRVGLDHIKEKK